MGSGREHCWLRSLTWVNQEFLMLWWRTYRPCWKRILDGPRRATMWRMVYWCYPLYTLTVYQLYYYPLYISAAYQLYY